MLINLFFLSTAFIFGLGQLGRISLLNQEVNFYLYEIFLIIDLLLLLIKYWSIPLKRLFKQNKIILIFIIFLLFSFINGIFNFNWQQNLVALLYLLRLISYPIYFYYLNWHFRNAAKKSIILKFAVGYLIFIVLTVGFCQYIFYPDLRNLYYLGWDVHLYRMFGQFFDTATSGAIYGLIFLAIFLSRINSKIKIFVLLLSLSAVLLSFSRLVFLAMIVSSLIYFIKHHQWHAGIIFLFIFILLIFFLPKPAGEGVNLLRTVTVKARWENYQQGFAYWLKSPLFGYGYNRIRYLLPQSQSNLHSGASFSSSYLVILVTTGILGGVFFLRLLLILAKINQFSFYGLVFLGFASVGDNLLLQPLVIFVYAVLILFFINNS
jgi:O-antigen ligase